MAETLDYQAAWGRLEGTGTGPVPSNHEGELADRPPSPKHRHYRPFSSAVNDFAEEAKDSNRIFLGVPELDAQMRGIGTKHLLILNGYSHSGKTLLMLHFLRHNRTKRAAVFTPDETAEMILASLAAQTSGMTPQELEERIQRDDAEAIALLRNVATEEFPKLAVFEEALTPSYIEEALDELEQVWGGHDLVVIDYARLLQAGEDMNAKFDYIKSLSKRRGPVIALNQTSRSAGADGRELTIASGEYGGEAYATFVIGVRRKLYESMAMRRELQQKKVRGGRGAAEAAEKLVEVEEDIKLHEHTLTVNLVKTKRVGGRLVGEMDFEIDNGTGRLTPLGDRLPSQYVADQRRSFRAAETPYFERPVEFDF